MPLKERVLGDLQQGMRRRGKARILVLRLILARIQNAEIEQQRTLTDAEVQELVTREARQHRESIKAFRDGNRPDLVEKEEAEMAVLLEYLPDLMSRAEITAMARETMAQLGAKVPADKGRVMGRLMPQLRGHADGAEVNAIVTELLAQR